MGANLREKDKINDQIIKDLDVLKLDKVEVAQKQGFANYLKQKQQFQVENYLADKVTDRLLLLTNRVAGLTRLVD